MPDVTGRRSETEGSEGIREIWSRAKQMPPSPSGGEWVPWRVVKVDFGILPRTSQVSNPEMVAQYVETFDQLPPIKVQKDTFVLIDGLTRLTAAQGAQSDVIRIVEDPVSDADLWIAAFEENALHGQALTTKERERAAKRQIKESNWSDGRIASWAGVHRNSVMNWRNKMPPNEGGQVAHFVQPGSSESSEAEPPSRRVGVDGKSYPTRPSSPAPTSNVAPEPSSAPQPPSAAQARVGAAPAPEPSSGDLFRQYRKRYISETVELMEQAQSESEWRSALHQVSSRCNAEAMRLLPEPTVEELAEVPFG